MTRQQIILGSVALALKIMAGWTVGWVYQNYYHKNADTWQYDWQAKVINQIATQNPDKYLLFMRTIYEPDLLTDVYARCHCIKPRTMLMVKIVSIFYRFTNNNYWITSALFSVFAFSGLWYAVLVLSRVYLRYKMSIYAGFLFTPSVVVWSSGILKETVMIGAIGYIIGICFSWYKQPFCLTVLTLCKITVLIVFVGTVTFLKYYYAATLFPVLIAFFSAIYLSKIYGYSVQKCFWIVWVLLILAGMCLHPNLYPGHLIESVYRNHVTILGKIQNQDNILFFYNLSPTWYSFLINAPLTLVQGLLMPYVWKATNIFQLITSLENVTLTGLVLSNLFLKKDDDISCQEKKFEHLTAIAILIFSLSSLVWLGLAVPNAGSLVRYKVGFMPFLVSLLLAKILATPKTSLPLQ